MLPFRSEIRNSPTCPTIKIYLSDESLDTSIKAYLDDFNGIDAIELQESIGRNRVNENITIFVKDNTDIGRLKNHIDNALDDYFQKV